MSSSRADPRRSSAEPNVSTLNPSERSSLRIAMRTDSSSSTTPTISMTRSSTGVASISATSVALGGAVYLLDLGVIRLRRRASRVPLPPQRALGRDPDRLIVVNDDHDPPCDRRPCCAYPTSRGAAAPIPWYYPATTLWVGSPADLPSAPSR